MPSSGFFQMDIYVPMRYKLDIVVFKKRDHGLVVATDDVVQPLVDRWPDVALLIAQCEPIRKLLLGEVANPQLSKDCKSLESSQPQVWSALPA